MGLDHYEVRSWVGWHHHMTLSLVAMWFLCLERRRVGGENPGNHGVADATDREEIALVTDSSGCLRYRLAAGDYRLRVADGVETAFAVAIGRWTSVRMRLPERCSGA